MRRYLEAYLGDDIVIPFEFRPGFNLERAAHRALGQMVLMLVEEDTHNAGAMSDHARITSFLDATISTMLLYCPHNLSHRMSRSAPAPAPRDVKRALDYIHDNFDKPVALLDLVTFSGVPGRALNQHFRTYTGLSPMAHPRRKRLRTARRLLPCGSSENITEAALSCGITHLGRFSQAYRAEFGELPSKTLSRRH